MTKDIVLIRICSEKEGTFGVLKYDRLPFAVTLEREWQDNIPSISCIPKGSYVCELFHSNKFKMITYRVVDVPNRTSILFHRGNLRDDSEGCILVAESFVIINKRYGVGASTLGFNEFMKILDGAKEFKLTIVETW